MIKKSEYRNDIQIIRGLAVFVVVLFHANEKYFSNGFLGVDVFFVISGFVVTPLLIRIVNNNDNFGKKMLSLRNFYKKRFFRLAPALIFVLTISIIIIFLLGSPDYHQRFAYQGLFTLFLLGNIGAYGFSGDYFSPNPNPLVHFWSLSVEEQIYLFFPLFLVVCFIKLRYSNKKSLYIFFTITIISLISFLIPEILQPIYSKIGIRSATQFSFYSPFDRMWQFTLGGIGCLALESDYLGKKKINNLINPLLIIIILMSLFSIINFGLKYNSIFISLLTLLAVLLKSFNHFPIILQNTFKWLGDRSYSIYLIHMPILWVAKYSLATQIGDSENRFIQILMALGIILLLGSISFTRVENRYRINHNNNSQVNVKTIKLLSLLLLPLTLLVAMNVTVEKKYWGFDKNIIQPIFPGNLDSYCVNEAENSRPCIYRKSDKFKTMLLVGDSHASHFSEAFKTVASNTGWNLVIWTKNGCQVKFSESARDASSINCINSFLNLKKWIITNKPDVVVVSEYVRSDTNLNQLQNALSIIKLYVPHLLLIDNNPIFPGSDRFLEARPLIMPPAKPEKFFLKSEMVIKDEVRSNEIGAWARDNEIDTMEIQSLFCNSTGCARFLDGNWLYRDPSHLSIAGANLIIPKLSDYLKSISR